MLYFSCALVTVLQLENTAKSHGSVAASLFFCRGKLIRISFPDCSVVLTTVVAVSSGFPTSTAMAILARLDPVSFFTLWSEFCVCSCNEESIFYL